MQVKFRGNRVDGQGWVVGDLNTRFSPDGKPYILPHNTKISALFEVEPSSIGMFTGLTDKNGKEIFGAIGEKGGDIVLSKFSERPLHIEYISSLAAFGAWGTPSDISLYGHQLHYFGGIIGNATDNPELLEK